MTTETRYLTGPLITVDAADTVLPAGEIAHDPAGRLTYVGPPRGPLADGDLDWRDHIVMPGLVNSHAHSAMTLLRGVCDDAEFPVWLQHVQAVEKHMDAADLLAGLRLAVGEMLLSGTTCFADMFHWDAALLAAVRDIGIRVAAAPALFAGDTVGFPLVSADDGNAVLERTEHLAAEFAGDPLIRINFGPHAPYTCPPEMLTEVGNRAERLGIGIQIHLSETAAEVASFQERGHTPIEVAEETGLLRNPTLIAHAVHATETDMALMARRNATVAHNPISNLKLCAGVAPVRKFRQAGVRVALGTDGPASNNSLDLFEEIRLAAVLHRGVQDEPGTPFPTAAATIRSATRNGAIGAGFDDTGSLEVGRAADFIAVRTDTLTAAPDVSALSHVAYGANGHDVRHVVVAGRQLVADGELVGLDAAQLRADARASAAKMREQAQL